MNTVSKTLAAITVACIVTVITPDAAPSWTLAGLEGEKINVILPMTGFSGNALIVGTDKGIRWHQSGYWDTA